MLDLTSANFTLEWTVNYPLAGTNTRSLEIAALDPSENEIWSLFMQKVNNSANTSFEAFNSAGADGSTVGVIPTVEDHVVRMVCQRSLCKVYLDDVLILTVSGTANLSAIQTIKISVTRTSVIQAGPIVSDLRLINDP